MPAVASDWVVDAASDIKSFRALPYRRVVRVRLQSGASTYPSGDEGVPLPLNARMGLRKSPSYVSVIHGITAATGETSRRHWQYAPNLGRFQAYFRNPTVSLATAFILTEVVSGLTIAGSVLYIEVHGL